ncbi:MAG: hypothetical protein AAFZ17_18755 [Cyanobacteria bacterium J06650_10]
MQLDSAHPKAINCLIELLCTTDEERLLWSLHLDDIGLASPKLIRTLIKMSAFGSTQDVRARSMVYLGRIVMADENAISKMLSFTKIPSLIVRSVRPSIPTDMDGSERLKTMICLIDALEVDDDRKQRKYTLFDFISFIYS